MFRDQWLVYVDAVDPGNPGQKVHAQLLVDKRVVADARGEPKRNSPVPAWLRVSPMDKEGEFIRVILPQSATLVGSNVLIEEALVKQEVGV